MIKIFFAILFFIMKKIFIKENRVPNKFMDTFANRLHSVFLYTSFFSLYLLWFDLVIGTFSINLAIYFGMFLQTVVVVRYFNHKMLITKELQVKMLRKINKFSLVIFVVNWIFLSFGFAFLFLIVLLFNNGIYIFIISQIEKQKEQAEFKKQFGERNYSKEEIVKKHIVNLFESELEVTNLTKSDIKKQYRVMAKRYHPDVYKGDEQNKFESINSSYTFLLELIKT